MVFSGDSIPKSINIENLKSRLYNPNCSCRFSGDATSKHFHHYIRSTLNEKDVMTDIVVLHMGTNDINDIINSEVNPLNDRCSPSYRNQSINLHCKSIDWFLYDGEH